MHATAAFDVIGDVHGYADKLERLLSEFGYTKCDDAWSHPDRTAVFIGDLIDRGTQQLATVKLVRAMVAHGSAHIVMGNHEYNAIAWGTRHPDRPDEYLRPHHGAVGTKNRHQHAAFLDAVGQNSAEHLEVIEWFKTLPLWLDLGSARFVHTCWSPTAIALLAPRVGPGNTLTHDVLVSSSTKHHPDYEAVETLLKGPEIDLPPGFAYLDKDGIHRERARYAWWDPDATTYRTAAIIPDNARAADGTTFTELPDEPIAALPSAPYDDEVPLFVGHYWRTGEPAVLHDQVACVDYSAGKGGPLVAYRFNGEPVLSASSFISVE